jgi:hypothetical protein
MTAHAIANLYRPSRNNRMGPASQVCSVPPVGFEPTLNGF